MEDTVITYADLMKMLSATDPNDIVTRSLILVAWDLGASMRVLSSLVVADIHLDKGEGSITLPGGKFPISREATDALRQYLKTMKLKQRDKLFPVQGTKPAHERRLQRLIEKAALRVGIKGLTLQGIRKSRALTLVPYETVQYVSRLFGITMQAAALYYESLPFDPADKSLEDAFFGLRPLATGEYGYTPEMTRVLTAILKTKQWSEQDLDAILLSPSPEATQLRRFLVAAAEIDDPPIRMGGWSRDQNLLGRVIKLPEVKALMEAIKKIANET